MKDAFRRAKAMFTAIAAAMVLPLDEQRAALAGVGTYRSHGHGLGLPGNKHSRRKVAMDKRDARRARNKARA